MKFEEQALISGIGVSAVGRGLQRSTMDLSIEAALAAMADAGVERDEIDGLASYPGAGYGFEYSPLVAEMQDALRLRLRWLRSSAEGPSPIQAVLAAVGAVANGSARHVLVYLGTAEATGQGGGGRRPKPLSGANRYAGAHPWGVPFGAIAGANWAGWMAMLHFHRYGTRREQLGALATTQRANAALNPLAIFRDRPMSLEDYMAARMISTPLCLFDCDLPCDGAVALVVSHRDFAPDCKSTPIAFEAVGTALLGRPSWDQGEDLASMSAVDAAAQMWERTDLTPSDIDTAHVYDGFSILTLIWLEALGFCGRGESGAFIGDGTRIRRDGELPLNTDGGQLSAGRLHGYGHLLEACLQLRGAAGERQVRTDRGLPKVSVVGIGAGYLCGSMLLRPFT